MNVLSKDRKKFDEAIDSFDKYDDIVNRILAIVRYPEREKSLRNACNEIYFKIKKKNAKKTWIENEFEIRSSYLSEMEKITENYSDFIYFLGDLNRCSSFVTSLYPEDVPGEKEWKYVNCQVEKSSLGYIILISAIDMNGKEAKIQFDLFLVVFNQIIANRENACNLLLNFYWWKHHFYSTQQSCI